MTVFRACIAATIVAVALVAPPSVSPVTAASCARTAMPFAGVAGANLEPTDYVSKDRPPVRYTRWRGFVPGFDGMPFSVDVTVPCGVRGPQPAVVMAHGFTDDKTIWEETGRSDRVISQFRPATNSHWNNIWFASRGYVTVNYTARGWHDSCGPDSAGATPGVGPGPQCMPHQYWIHLDDKRWEVRDAQWLAGGLVQSGVADPARLAITGGSYGGGPASMGAVLGSRIMCGGSPVPVALGPDPCNRKGDGELVRWRTPDGSVPLRWAAALPMYTFADLIQVLAPNGRGTDGARHAPHDGDHTRPFGVPIASTIAGLLAAGNSSGFFARPGTDPNADITMDSGRILAGNPFPADDPFVIRGVRVYRDFKSPITTTPVDRVPIMWVQGMTDPLFPATEALQMYAKLRTVDSAYPIKLFLGDVGHDYSGERKDEWDLAHTQMNAFLDHYLRPDRTTTRPAFDVTATITRCLDQTARRRAVNAPTWKEISDATMTFTGVGGGVTASTPPGQSGLATDPISTATLPLPGAYKGCRRVRPARTDPAAVTFDFPVRRELTLLGGPVVRISYVTNAPDVELNVRVWDVAPDQSVQGLITRGTYRSLDGPGTELEARFQLAPQGYRFAKGHTIRVEVAANDAPYFQTSNVPAVAQIEALSLTVPLSRSPGGR